MGNVLIRRGQPDRRHVFAALVAIVFLGGASAVPANAIDDRSPPTQPGPITTSALTSSSVSLAWRASSDDVRVVGYRIYRGAASVPDSDLTLIATIDAITTYKATALYSGTSYKFGVVAIDLANNASPIRTAVVSTLSSSDTAPPAAPSSSSVSGTAFSESRIDVVWGGSGSTDVAGYLVYRNGAQVGRIDLPGGLRFSDNGLAASTSYDYALKAVDSAGNLSAGTTPRPAAERSAR